MTTPPPPFSHPLAAFEQRMRQIIEGASGINKVYPEPDWMDVLDERDRKEIDLARRYAWDPHGTTGHHRLMLIAHLADLLDTYATPPPEVEED